jgi:alpha-L-arabinofuranosidase
MTTARAALTLFALNRSLDEELSLDVTARGFSGLAVAQALALRDRDLDAANTKDDPERIRPAPLTDVLVEAERLRATLAPASWNVIRLGSLRPMMPVPGCS